jgi:hypothetical protein
MTREGAGRTVATPAAATPFSPSPDTSTAPERSITRTPSTRSRTTEPRPSNVTVSEPTAATAAASPQPPSTVCVIPSPVISTVPVINRWSKTTVPGASPARVTVTMAVAAEHWTSVLTVASTVTVPSTAVSVPPIPQSRATPSTARRRAEAGAAAETTTAAARPAIHLRRIVRSFPWRTETPP